MGLDAELYTCHKDDLNIEKVFLYNGFIVTGRAIFDDLDEDYSTRENIVNQESQVGLDKYALTEADSLYLLHENLSRNAFNAFVDVYKNMIDENGFINGCYTVLTYEDVKTVLDNITDGYKIGWVDNLENHLYLNDKNMRYIFRADW